MELLLITTKEMVYGAIVKNFVLLIQNIHIAKVLIFNCACVLSNALNGLYYLLYTCLLSYPYNVFKHEFFLINAYAYVYLSRNFQKLRICLWMPMDIFVSKMGFSVMHLHCAEPKLSL